MNTIETLTKLKTDLTKELTNSQKLETETTNTEDLCYRIGEQLGLEKALILIDYYTKITEKNLL